MTHIKVAHIFYQCSQGHEWSEKYGEICPTCKFVMGSEEIGIVGIIELLIFGEPLRRKEHDGPSI